MVAKSKKFSLSLVMGPPSSGKTTWCKRQQEKLPNVFVIPYDEMLYRLRGTYNVTQILKNIVTRHVEDMVESLMGMSETGLHILVDGYAEDIKAIDSISVLSDNFSIFHMKVPALTCIRYNMRKKKAGLPCVRVDLPKRINDSNQFFDSNVFQMLVEHLDAQVVSLNPFLENESLFKSIDKTVNEYVF